MNVPFCVHCAGPTGMASMRSMADHPDAFPLYCDGCGFVTRLVTLEQFRRMMAALDPDGDVPIPEGTNCVLFCEEPEATA